MREKLIEFVHDARMNALWHNAPNQSEYMTDMLIANGVTIPVRCKECKHWKPSGSMAGNSEDDLQPIGGCEWANCCRKANDFCSYGERKYNETD